MPSIITAHIRTVLCWIRSNATTMLGNLNRVRADITACCLLVAGRLILHRKEPSPPSCGQWTSCSFNNCNRGATLLKHQSNCFWKPGSFHLCQIWKQKILRCFCFVCLANFLMKRCRVDMVIECGAARDKIHECCEGRYKGWGDMEADHPL